MALPDLTGQNIQDTYQRVIHTDGTSTFNGTGSKLPISFDGNNVVISGSLTAQTYVVSESILNVSSGSTVFGNSNDDTHTFTGDITASGNISSSGTITSLSASIDRIDSINIDATGFLNSDTIKVSSNAILTEVGGEFLIGDTGGIIKKIQILGNNLLINPSITASGNISSSKDITAKTGSFDYMNLSYGGKIALEDSAGNKNDVLVHNLADTALLLGDSDSNLTIYGGVMLLDSESDITLDCGGDQIFFKESGNSRIEFLLGATKNIITTDGNLHVEPTDGFISSSGNISILGNFSASGGISSSGIVTAQSYNIGFNDASRTLFAEVNDAVQWGEQDITSYRIGKPGSGPLNNIDLEGHVTASGNIEAGSYISASEFRTTGHITASGDISSSGTITSLSSSIGRIDCSGDISASLLYSNGFYGNPIARFYPGGDDPGFGFISAGEANIIHHNVTTTAVQSIHAAGDITASIISASGTIVGFNLSGTNTGDQNISNLAITGSDVIFNHVTASGNVSASGAIISDRVYPSGLGGAFITVVNDQIFSSTGFTGTHITASGIISGGSDISGERIQTPRIDAIGDRLVITSNLSASGNINAFAGGTTGSQGRAGTQGWGHETGSFCLISIPPTEFQTVDQTSTRFYGMWARGVGAGYMRAGNSAYNYYASYVIPKGYKVRKGAVYATGGAYKAYVSTITNASDATEIAPATTCHLPDFAGSGSIDLIADADQWAETIGFPGNYVTILFNPATTNDDLSGASIILEVC